MPRGKLRKEEDNRAGLNFHEKQDVLGRQHRPTSALPSPRAPVWPLSSGTELGPHHVAAVQTATSHLLCHPKLLHGTWQDTHTAAEARAGPAKGSMQTAQLSGSRTVPSALIRPTHTPGNSHARAICPKTPTQNPQTSGELRNIQTGQQIPCE